MNMGKRKGITLEMVAGVILAVAGVGILIAMTSGMLGGTFKDIYCGSYQGITFLLSGGSESAPPPPEQCRPKSESCETVVLEDMDNKKVSLKILSLLIDCWDKYKGYGNVSKCCGSFNIKDMNKTINESMINGILRNQRYCPQEIQNSEIENPPSGGKKIVCGDKNQIKFEYEKIKEGDYVIVRFEKEKMVVR